MWDLLLDVEDWKGDNGFIARKEEWNFHQHSICDQEN